jgi:hypothetical protein
VNRGTGSVATPQIKTDVTGGVDVTVIRDILGHASIATTSRYITTNLQMKREALEAFWKHAGISPNRSTPWKPKPNLLAFLASL